MKTTAIKYHTVKEALDARGLKVDSEGKEFLLTRMVEDQGEAARLDAPRNGSPCLTSTYVVSFTFVASDRYGHWYRLDNGVAVYKDRGALVLAWIG